MATIWHRKDKGKIYCKGAIMFNVKARLVAEFGSNVVEHPRKL